jgi:hypothetical protein
MSTAEIRNTAQRDATAKFADARGNIAVTAFVGSVAAALGWAWLYRADATLSPEEGAGYWLGIAGATMMLGVLLYPLRKRLRVMRSWGRLPTWFRWHMVFGFLGPALVVMHSDFSARSLNAFAALVSMLTVAASGIVGRYLYVRIHRGLYGAKLEVRELVSDVAAIRSEIGRDMGQAAQNIPLPRLEELVAQPATSL